MSEIRVILADDHAILRSGVRAILEGIPEVTVVAEAGNGEQALKAIAEHKPDVLLTDISMPGMSGLELASRVADEWPDTRVLVLSMHADKEYATKAMALGTAGYILKDANPDELGCAVRAVARGEGYMSPAVLGHVTAEFARMAKAESESSGPLTPRQIEVLRLVAEGLPTKAIAKQLKISVKTAEAHRSGLMERLGIHDVAGLVRYAIRTGLIKSDD